MWEILKKFSKKHAESCLFREGHTVTETHYAEILTKLFETVHAKRPEL
jgi:hypothetical protein